MTYAINSTNTGWRAINSVDDLLEGETYSEVQPAPIGPNAADQVIEKLTAVRKVRELILGRILGIKDAARDDGNTELVDACKAARIGLLQITDDCPTDPDLVDQFIKDKYDTITAGMPLTLLMAFARLDQ